MIPKISSHELNNIMEAAKQELDKTNKKFETAKKDISDKIKVITYESEYASHVMTKIETGSYMNHEGMISFCKLPTAEFEKYGSTIHSKLIKEPINVFNLHASGLGEAFFREDVVVAINNAPLTLEPTEWEKQYDYNDSYTSILKDDTLQKDIFFDTFKNRDLTIRIELKDTSAILGPTRFNCMELDPFLCGSFDIRQLRIYEFKSTGEVDEEPYIINNITSVGKERIVFSKKINFYRLEMDVEIKYETYRNTSPVYPFGLKHVYFYDMDFKPESYLIAEIKNKDNIAYIKSEIEIKSPFGMRNSTIETEEIELYLDYDNGKLSTQIEASTPNDIREIARNVKTIYAKIPLSTKSSVIGIAFHTITRTQTT